ncbi:MAG: hypothetical protein ACETVY_06970 [Candidatus Bathyarchaeia archaeon]
MSRKSQKKVHDGPYTGDIPAWARDNLVLKLLDDRGLNLEVVYDRKYLNGLCDRPLIVIRSKRRVR